MRTAGTNIEGPNAAKQIGKGGEKKKTTSKVCIWLGKKPFISDTEFSKVLI